MANFQPVIFKLGTEMYGINILNVSGIENGYEIIRVPNSSGDIKGIINLRGDVIPVINLKAKFGLPADDAQDADTLIIVRTADSRIALEVDAVEKIHTLDDSEIVDMPVVARGSGIYYFNKVAKIEGKLIIMIETDRLLSDEESSAVQELINS